MTAFILNLAVSRCATNGCDGDATRACHVIMANQNSDSGIRYIVHCCPTCNGQTEGQTNDIRRNAENYMLDDCDC